MTKPEPLTKDKIIAEKYENFFREQDVKSAVQGLLQEIEKEIENIERKHWYEVKKVNFQTPEEWLGYLVCLKKMKDLIKKAFEGVMEG